MTEKEDNDRDNDGDNGRDNGGGSNWLITVAWGTKAEGTRQKKEKKKNKTRQDDSHCGSQGRRNCPIARNRAPRHLGARLGLNGHFMTLTEQPI